MMPTRLITRRRAIMTGLAAAAAGFVVTRDWRHLPPTYGNLLRMGDNLTYAALRALPRQSLVKEYSRADISSFPAINTTTFPDAVHSESEQRYITVGLSARRRLLVVSHADWDGDTIRIISARVATRREREFYEEEE